MKSFLLFSALLLPATLLTPIAFSSVAQARPSQGESECKGEDRRPPREAIEACEDLQLQDPCSFADREGQPLEGVCFLPEDAPADAPAACRPEGPPPPRR